MIVVPTLRYKGAECFSTEAGRGLFKLLNIFAAHLHLSILVNIVMEERFFSYQKFCEFPPSILPFIITLIDFLIGLIYNQQRKRYSRKLS